MHEAASGGRATLRGDAQDDEEACILVRSRADPSSFAPIYERYLPRIYTYCLRRLGHAQEAEDITAVVFGRALAGVQTYRGGSVAAWLFRIAHNSVANHLRDRRHDVSLDRGTDRPCDDRGNDQPLESVIATEERDEIRRLVRALPEEQQELLALRLIYELSAREIGSVIGKSEGAVRTALYRLFQQLGQQYVRHGEEDTDV